MKPNSIDWHKDCLKNRHKYIERMQKELQELQTEINASVSGSLFYHKQIMTAESEGIKEFDREKYLVKRNKKNA